MENNRCHSLKSMLQHNILKSSNSDPRTIAATMATKQGIGCWKLNCTVESQQLHSNRMQQIKSLGTSAYLASICCGGFRPSADCTAHLSRCKQIIHHTDRWMSFQTFCTQFNRKPCIDQINASMNHTFFRSHFATETHRAGNDIPNGQSSRNGLCSQFAFWLLA